MIVSSSAPCIQPWPTTMLAKVRLAFARIYAWMVDRPHAVHSLGLLRAVLGLCGLAFYVADYDRRHILFAPGGLETAQMAEQRLYLMSSRSLYYLDGSSAWFELVFHGGMLAALLVMLGIGGRISLLIHYALIWSLYVANPVVLDGGDNLVMILGVLLLFTRCSDAFSLRRSDPRRPGFAQTALHNGAVLAIALQICIVYVMAGMYKVQGRLWQDGTALYYVLRVPEFYWPGITDFVFHLGPLLVIGAYATVLMSIYFPALVVFRQTRLLAVLLMSTFHGAIAVLMGLTSFALIMIACDLIFVDRHVVQCRIALGRLVNHARARALPRNRRQFAPTASPRED